jgi:argininosuccinate synthase
MAVAALAFSGGLDTSFAVLALKREGYDVVTVTADTGGFSPAELEAIEVRARAVGAVDHVAVDARREVYDRFFSRLIQGNVLRGGVYPVAVGAERFLQAEILVRVARERGCEVVAHGCTGAGNDQVRFDVAVRALAPELKLLAPIRDGEVTREQSTAALREAGVEIPPKQTRYSVNAGLVGTTVGGGDTHDPWAEIPEEAFAEAGSRIDPDAPETELTLGFRGGLPVSLDGEELDPLALLARVDAAARPLGIGRGTHLGDTILGIKGRIGFVAPAATVIIAAHRELEKLVLTKRQIAFKDAAGALFGDLLHEALYLDPVCRDVEAALASSQERVAGDVRVGLRALACEVRGVRSPHALVRPGARYGEESSLWDGRDAQGFARIYGLASRLAEESR